MLYEVITSSPARRAGLANTAPSVGTSTTDTSTLAMNSHASRMRSNISEATAPPAMTTNTPIRVSRSNQRSLSRRWIAW